MKLTVFYDGQFWVGVVEEVVNGKLRAGKYLFGSEPKDQEVFAFVNTKLLDFMNGVSEQLSVENRQPRKMNPKRLARQAAREMKANGVSTFAQAALQLEYEKRKKEKQILRRDRREALKEYKREIKRKKAKEKHRGR
ncbi:YjdF family protein [Paenibacillus ginsengihumi]|uniref:YjdF family protein n=1 Tax=Paenibacillus ginsengihumi TaxID=431596 RepID=UPI000377C76B|nr:YjdF family protein [Paenibacillus ginsengihumi]